MGVLVAFRVVDGIGPLQCGKCLFTLQVFGTNGSGRGMGHDNLSEHIFVHGIDIVKAKAANFTSLVGWGEDGNKIESVIQSGKYILELGLLDHRAHIAEVV